MWIDPRQREEVKRKLAALVEDIIPERRGVEAEQTAERILMIAENFPTMIELIRRSRAIREDLDLGGTAVPPDPGRPVVEILDRGAVWGDPQPFLRRAMDEIERDLPGAFLGGGADDRLIERRRREAEGDREGAAADAGRDQGPGDRHGG